MEIDREEREGEEKGACDLTLAGSHSIFLPWSLPGAGLPTEKEARLLRLRIPVPGTELPRLEA